MIGTNQANNNDSLIAKASDVECGRPADQYCKEIKCRNSVTRWFQRCFVMLLLLGAVGGIAAVVWYFLGWMSLLQLVLVAVVAFVASGRRYRWFYVAACTAKRDLTALGRFIRLVIKNRSYARSDTSIVDAFRANVRKHPDKVAFLFEGKEMTFQQMEDYSNKVANIYQKHGYRKGDIVALFLENRPEFVCLWMGLVKLGIVVPLINYNQRDQSLLHSFNVASAQAVIYGSELASAMQDISGSLKSGVELYEWSEKVSNELAGSLGKNLTALIQEASAEPPVLDYKLNYDDKLMYIYTSGTTGLPKAAVITGARFMFLASAIHILAGFKPSDRYYIPLPLYHTAGGIVNVGQLIVFGSTVAIRRKFSASAYFADCQQYGCTVAQYIGEMCRYVLATPPKPEDTQHKVRLIFGNGLRPQIWKHFVERFNIPRVAEFYGATEGNANIVNIDNTFGAVGFVSRIIPSVYPISVIKADPDTGDPIRDHNGLCQVCGPDEPGVFIGKIIRNDPSREFLGYVDKKASEKKIVRDVFRKGDAAFLSGDIVVSDEFGYLYFRDRTGDTFRWKGENVSTTEVEGVVSNLVNYRDSVVYGVEISGQEGRAGMAAILDDNNSLDLNALAEGLKAKLPPYARPQFVRRLEKVDVTGTFKLKKVELQKEGYDPKVVKDRLYYMAGGKYELITPEVFEAIQAGKIRF